MMALLLHLPLLLPSKNQSFLKSSSSKSFQVLQRMAYLFPITCLSNSGVRETSSSSPARRTANFQPTIWDDNHIQSLPIDFMEDKYVKLREKLKEEVRCMIGKQYGLIDQLEFVDVLRQLGVAYHFDSEIKDLLNSFNSSEKIINSLIETNNLHHTSLMFRLLREHVIDASILSADILMSGFRSKIENLNINHEHDVKGMLSLYEASFLAVEGEDELDDSGDFATKYLRNLDKSLLDQQLIEEIDHALELPLHWRMPRLHTRWYIDVYKRQENMNPILLEFAKLDFNMVQCVYKQELKEMSRWWINLGLICDELSFVRDRLVEHYLWSSGFNFRPEFWRCRKAVTKIICFATTLDDIYDIYGTMDELELFTNVVQGWKISASEELPNYMKICLTALFKTMDEIANDFSMEKGLNILPCLKRMWGDLCKAYLVEARWYYTGYTPTLNEYLENAWISIGGTSELTAAYCLSNELTIEALNNLEFYPPIVRSSCMLFRLYNDLATEKEEIKRGDAPKSVQCFMNENNVCEMEAEDYIKILVRKYWKELNGMRYRGTNYMKCFQEAVVDVPRMAQCMYQFGDGHSEPNQETKDRVILLLMEPISP
uniref:Geraniol synthase 1 n=1 Tax=Caladenia plicata TaxID=672428 RepID=A0A218MY44_9ASPA|nr:geraniol synthase 1 [Caladenia plicata]